MTLHLDGQLHCGGGCVSLTLSPNRVLRLSGSGQAGRELPRAGSAFTEGQR